jgi:hypothetical protein
MRRAVHVPPQNRFRQVLLAEPDVNHGPIEIDMGLRGIVHAMLCASAASLGNKQTHPVPSCHRARATVNSGVGIHVANIAEFSRLGKT